MNNHKKLNLGCGNNYKEGYINLDNSEEVNPDIIWDLEVTPLPLSTDSIDLIEANHILEHIQGLNNLMDELWRILKPNGILKIKVPFYSYWGQYNDITHVRTFSPFSFDYYKLNKYSHEVNFKNIFIIEKVKLRFAHSGVTNILNLLNPFLNISHKIYCRFFAWIIPVAEIQFKLRKETSR